MKQLIIFLVFITIATITHAQSFFHPLPKPHSYYGNRMGISSSGDTILNVFRPIADITATVSNGTQLAGGFGISFQHEKWSSASQSYITQYSISGIGFVGTNGTKITGTGGLVFGIPGTNGIIQMGPGWDFTNKVWVLLTGVGITFN